MTTHVIFIQGAGRGAYEEDKALATNLQTGLGPDYAVHYPAMPNEEDAQYDQWKRHIAHEVATVHGPIMLVGHSVGASILMKCMSALKLAQPPAGLFLLEAPFWGGDGWRYDGYEQLALPQGVATRLPQGMAIFLYHCRDDTTVPFDHLALYAQVLPQATVRALDAGGHQLNNDLSAVAQDIKSLQV
jgi:serine hydrolase